MTNAEAWFNIALRPRKPEGSLGRTAQDGHLDSHTAPELYGTLLAQRTSFNTLDNWGHKTPTQSKKRKDDRKERVKGSWPWTHTINALSYIYTATFRGMTREKHTHKKTDFCDFIIFIGVFKSLTSSSWLTWYF